MIHRTFSHNPHKRDPPPPHTHTQCVVDLVELVPQFLMNMIIFLASTLFFHWNECLQSWHSYREEKAVLTRLLIGNSYFTRFFLSKREEPSVCASCNERLAVEHSFYCTVQT